MFVTRVGAIVDFVDIPLSSDRSRGVGGVLVLLLLHFTGCARSSSEPQAGQPAGPRPNVVLVVIDVLRADHMPFLDYSRNTAPFLGELAARGVVFRHTHSASSWTAPATASILTSLFPHQHRVITGLTESRNFRLTLHRIPEEAVTVAELFQENGYRTFGVTDNVNVSARLGFEQGFDRFENGAYRQACPY